MNEQLVVLTIGHVNANKCCDLIIQAIAASVLCRETVYRIVGPVLDVERRRLEALAKELNVQLILTGRVDDQCLADELHQADIVSCLRKPILEGGSATAIEAMLSQRPIIVPDAGCYHDIDDGAAIKLPPDLDIPSISAALDQLAGSVSLRDQIGNKGKLWAETNCNVVNYVDTLEKAIHAAIFAEPYLNLASNYALQLSNLGFDVSDAVSMKIATCLQELVDGKS